MWGCHYHEFPFSPSGCIRTLISTSMPTSKVANPTPTPKVILRLAVPSPLRRLFDYLAPEDFSQKQIDALVPGMRVRVPFGSRALVAVLVSLETKTEVPIARLRPALEILDE